MACCGRYGSKRRKPRMACFEHASPALKEILLQQHRAGKKLEIDQNLYEFGSVEYHIKSSASEEPHKFYLSISTPLLCPEILTSPHEALPCYTTHQKVKDICGPDVVEVIEPAREGYQLTLQINFANIPRGKDGIKIITKIASVQSTILSSQLKKILCSFYAEADSHGISRPIKLEYHRREPFFVIKQPHKITVIFPMRFKESSDVAIATSFFQELMDIGSCEEWAKTPPCTWSPVPPSELTGEPLEDLSTNGGFVSFDIFSRHIDEKRLDKTVWNLLNFYAYVKSHVKSTNGFIQRKMRKRLHDLVKAVQETSFDQPKHTQEGVPGSSGISKQTVGFSKFGKLRRRCSEFSCKIKRIRHRIKIHGFNNFRRRWLAFPKFPTRKYCNQGERILKHTSKEESSTNFKGGASRGYVDYGVPGYRGALTK